MKETTMLRYSFFSHPIVHRRQHSIFVYQNMNIHRIKPVQVGNIEQAQYFLLRMRMIAFVVDETDKVDQRERGISVSSVASRVSTNEPSAKLMNLYVSNWTDDEKCRQAQIRTKFDETLITRRFVLASIETRKMFISTF